MEPRDERNQVMYRVFKKLEDGELMHVASREEFEEAIEFARELQALWPGEYVVRDSEGNATEMLN